MYTLNLKISGIHCDACIKLITKRINSIVGVEKATVELSGQTSISSSRLITKEIVLRALSGMDYKVL